MAESIYWNPKETLSHNCLFNFVVGMRGGGKTYGSLKYGIDKWIAAEKAGRCSQILYVRRLKSELAKLTISRGGRLFNAVQNEFPGYELKAESNELLIRAKDGEKNFNYLGYAQPLSTASILKSDAMPNVDLIIFDEFIIDNKGTYHYLSGEVTKFLDLYETVARGRDVKVFFLSNAVTVSNPYFDYFHLDKPRNGRFQKFGSDILVENYVNEQLSNQKKRSRFGNIIAGTEYSDYAYDNEWLLDNNDFLEKKTQRSRYCCTLVFNGQKFGIWVDEVQWLYYVSTDIDPTDMHLYSVTTDDHKPNMLLLKAAKQLPMIKALMEAYAAGAVRYESVKLKNSYREVMRMCNNV